MLKVSTKSPSAQHFSAVSLFCHAIVPASSSAVGDGGVGADWMRAVTSGRHDNGHKALMPVITPRLSGHNARSAPGIIGVGVAILHWAY